jgi:hypothetical protein
MTSILRVAALALQARSIPPPGADTYDTQLAITQILLRSGWEQGVGGRVIKKVKAPLQSSPKIYVLEALRDGHLATRDRDGRVLAKVPLKPSMSHSDIMNAAKTLNNGAAKLVMADEDPV